MAVDREYLKQQAKLIRDEYRQGANTAHRVGSLLLAMIEAGVDINELSNYFLRKDKDDRTPFLLNVGEKLTAEKGIQIGESFVPGVLNGSGGFFDEFANGEVESLVIRRFLEVPELRYNRVQVTLGDKWNAPGAGVVERVVPDSDTTGTVFLKLEEGEYGAIAVGDICMGIFHSEVASENATADSDDSRGNFQFAGFYTCYFTVTEITGKDNGRFRYQLRPVNDRWKLQYHPRESMHFVCYGSFTDSDRQTSVYTTRTYTRMLKNQNTWEISASNIAMQYGNMENLSVHGLDMTGYSVYLNNIYMTGTLKQVKPDGTPVQTANDRGNWVSGTAYVYYDRVSHNGSLWLCVNEDGTNSEPEKGNSDWLLQVAAGDSLVAGGRFSSANAPYNPNSVVDFAGKAWVSTEKVSYAPYGCWTDKDGNRFTFADGGFCLVDEEPRDGWEVLLDTSTLKDGEDGKSLVAQYSADGVNWHGTFADGDVWMRQKLGDDGVWSGKMRIVGESGHPGEDGCYTEYEFAVADSMDTAPTSGWQDAPPSVGRGQYLWMRMRVVQGDGTAGNWSNPVRIGGEKGDSLVMLGRFHTGMVVPCLGVVQMGGSNWVAKVETSRPPLWCWTDKDGNRFTFADGGFCLTGEENTDEYELLVQNGKDGRDGTDFELVFYSSTTETRPGTPASVQTDDYVPAGWHDDPVGVSESVKYEWVSKRSRKDGLWGAFSTPALWAKYGEKGQPGQKGDKGDTGAEGKQGIQGCVIRDSEWTAGVEYRNDEDLTSGTRYIDVALVRNDSTTTGWVAYKCKRTHVSSSSITVTNTTYWEEFGANVSAIFTSLIVAKNAKIKFLQGNQLLIQKSDGTVTAGMSGSEEGGKVRFWAGSTMPDDAPFRVTEEGTMVAEDAIVKGVLRTPWKHLVYKLIYSSASGDVYGYDGSAIDNDKVVINPVITCELKIGWGDKADGREVAVRVNNTSNSRVYITVPTGFFAIGHDGEKVPAGENLTFNVGYIYYLTGCSDCWIVNRRISIVG